VKVNKKFQEIPKIVFINSYQNWKFFQLQLYNIYI